MAKSHSSKAPVPNAQQFLRAYLAMERPTTSHLYYSKGLLDFLVGMLIGIIIGIVLAKFI